MKHAQSAYIRTVIFITALMFGCMVAFASVSKAEESELILNPETETESTGLAPKEITGDIGWKAQYPEIENQLEQQLRKLSGMSSEQVEELISSYHKEINYSVREIAHSMDDTSVITEDDDTTMATVKMLQNYYNVMDSCGEFKGINEYTADMTDNIITFVMDAQYSQAESENTNVNVIFTYDLEKNVTLMDWELITETPGGGIRRGSDINIMDNLWEQIALLEKRVAALEAQLSQENE